MKLEVPNARIMAGEIKYLSPPACKLLITLIGCQDTNSLLPIVTLSKTAIAKKSGYTPRQVFRLLTELEDQNWIKREGSIIVFHTMSQPMTRDVTDYDKAMSQEKMSQPMTRDVTTYDKAMSYDPISTEDKEDQITTEDLIPMAELYLWNSRQMNTLMKEFHGKSKSQLNTAFIYMKRHSDTIDRPYAYIRKCMRNPAQEIFKAMISEMV